jgi:FlaA1/EpsC-like NDP-sugar epimerase
MKKKFNIRNRYILIGDLILIFLSVFGSYVLRVELLGVFYTYFLSLLCMLGISLILKPLVFYLFGLYRRIWIYASVRELRLIVLAVTTASALTSTIMLVLFNRVFNKFPRSVLIIDWILTLMFAGGLRFSMRMLAENRNRPLPFGNIKVNNALIIGAGDAGALVANELLKNPQLNLKLIGFLDDNPEKLNQQIHGISVIGRLKDLDKVINRRKIEEVIIAIPSAPGGVIREVINVCQKKSTHFRTMPGLYELLDGKVSISKLRDVEIADLLRRAPVEIDNVAVKEIIANKVVLVTGAGGSIGSELCRQIAQWNPKELILLGHGENSIFETYLEIMELEGLVKPEAVIADIRNINRIKSEFAKYSPDIVFHTAAHKHVPLMENNVDECVLNNVLGTRNIVEVCTELNIERLILISTDKAIRPVSIMGASKRLSEMIVLNAAEKYGHHYSVVRFGNVLGSRGSVVPLFKRQIANGGPVTVTHSKMKRYFMTIPEAVHLVLQATAIGTGAETYILNMGDQIRIVDLAEDLIRLSGLVPGKDIEIVFTGIREGEKLSEDLWNRDRKFNQTAHPDIFFEKGSEALSGNELEKAVQGLIELAVQGDEEQIITFINQLIPDAEIKISKSKDIFKI